MNHDDWRLAKELLATGLAAGVAIYARARSCPRPWSLQSIGARLAELILCGALANGAVAVMGWTDPRITVGLSAAFGLFGVDELRRFAMRIAESKVPPAPPAPPAPGAN